MELTEILVAVKQPDFQSTNPLSTKPETNRETSRSGKSFSELLAGLSSENQSEPVKEQVKQPETRETSQKKDEKVSSASDSKKEEPKEKVAKQEKNQTKNEKIESDSEEKTKKPELFAYSSLNLVREENTNAKDSRGIKENVREIGQIRNKIYDKMASRDDAERVQLLSNGQKVEVSEDFEFEIVSDEILALETAQKGSIENPVDFLNNLNPAEIPVNADETIPLAMDSGKNQATEKTGEDKLKSKLHVTDLRSSKPELVEKTQDEAEPKIKVTMTGSDSATVEMDLNQAQNQNFVQENILSVNNQTASSDGSNFQAMLQNQIQANASEIVKAGNIVLKDNNKGTIDLVLHPDDIGSVKVTLSLDGDKITGHIAVNTKEALEVFKNNAESLRDAFIKSGYENASFEVSYNASSNSGNQNFAQQSQQEQNIMFAKREYDSLNQLAEIPDGMDFPENFSDSGKIGINIVA